MNYVKLGCYSDNQVEPRPLPYLILTDKDSTVANYSRVPVNWANWRDYVPDLVCRCAELTQELGYEVFSIQYYGKVIIQGGRAVTSGGGYSRVPNSRPPRLLCFGKISTHLALIPTLLFLFAAMNP